MVKVNRRNFVKTAGAVSVGAASVKFLGADSLFVQTLTPVLPKVSGQGSFNEKIVPTTCWIGKQECGMNARVINDRIVKLDGHPSHPRNNGRLCPKGSAQLHAVYDPYRVKAPLKRTNAKGQTGEWQEISWDEANTTVGTKIVEARARGNGALVWQKGRSKAKKFYDTAFVKTTGATKLHHGAYCSDAAYRAAEITVGGHGGIHPDFHHTKFLLSYGWSMTTSGGNKMCWLTWPQQFMDARERGMKVATLDPFRSSMGNHTDSWMPIKPGSDLAFFLALAHQLVANRTIDVPYLKAHTNSGFLVKSDGKYLRANDKEQVWDAKKGMAVDHDADGADPAIEGSYTVGGVNVKPAFQVFKDHVSTTTPEWAEGITGISAATIRKLASDLDANAHIGETITIDGVELPYRPVAFMAYHVSQQELGFQAFRMAILCFTIMGSYEAVGGFRADTGRSVYKNFKNLNEISIGDGPYDIILNKSKFYPINSNNTSIIAHAMQNPSKYNIGQKPDTLIVHHANPVLSFLSQPDIKKNLDSYKFVAVIDPYLTETADYWADIVLPCATIEKYEGLMSTTDQYISTKTMRVPPIPPLFNSKNDIDIYTDICEKAGLLTGEGGWNDQVNKAHGLDDEFKLDLNKKYTAKEMLHQICLDGGYEGGLAYFEKPENIKKKAYPPNELYAPAWSPPYGGIKHRIYIEKLQEYAETMAAKGVDKIYWQDYTALPVWRTPTFWTSPSEYDLCLISNKKIEFKQSRATMIAPLNEMAPEQRLKINSKTAKAKGIKDGDAVRVTSQNALTGETRSVETIAQIIEGIHPGTVSMSHHYGFWVHPYAKDGGPTPNALFFTAEGYSTNTADQSYHVAVKVEKA